MTCSKFTRARQVILIVGSFVLAGAAAAAQAGTGISGSMHDFSALGWSGGEICVVCHTPHNSDITVADAPLWDHENTAATHTVYDSPTLDATVEEPAAITRLCLSCHDGTVATDSFGGNTGSNYVTGNSLIGTDLSDDHPVSFRWEHQTTTTCGDYCHFGPHGGGSAYSYELRFYNHRVECSTCHDPHNHGRSNVAMLRMPMAGSELCLICHNGK